MTVDAASKCFVLTVSISGALVRLGWASAGLEVRKIIERLFLLIAGATAGNRFISVQDCI